jgi:glycosyltransferase involved in cell wall biosynthesis
MGETWGLVVNEALHAGCGVVVSDAVGCSAEFGRWDRARVFPEGNTEACGGALVDLARLERSWDWAATRMEAYSVEAAARALAQQMPP